MNQCKKTIQKKKKKRLRATTFSNANLEEQKLDLEIFFLHKKVIAILR